MKTFFLMLLLSFVLLIQATWLPLFIIRGIKPDLFLVVISLIGLLYGKKFGAKIGFYGGLIQDLAFGDLFGLNILSKIAVGYWAGYIENIFFKKNIFLPMFAVALATILNKLVTVIYLYIFRFRCNPWTMLVNNIFPLIIYNVLLTIPVYLFIYKCNKRMI